MELCTFASQSASTLLADVFVIKASARVILESSASSSVASTVNDTTAPSLPFRVLPDWLTNENLICPSIRLGFSAFVAAVRA